MEKFRKFEDPRVGVNPFEPVKTKQLPLWKNCLRRVCQALLLLMRLPFIVILSVFYLFMAVLKFAVSPNYSPNGVLFFINACCSM